MCDSGGKDPRFDSTIGGKPFHQDEFAKRYSFLYNDVLPGERADLKKQIKVWGDEMRGRRVENGRQAAGVPSVGGGCSWCNACV